MMGADNIGDDELENGQNATAFVQDDNDDNHEGTIGQVVSNSQGRRPWYKQRRFIGGIVALVVVVLAIVLGVVLSQQNNNNSYNSVGSEVEDDLQLMQSTTGSNDNGDKNEEVDNDVTQSSSSSAVRAKDDTITITRGTDDIAFIDVLENDSTSNNSNLIVKSITAQATNGDCVISIDLQQVVYTLTDTDSVDNGNIGSDDKCTYETCIVDEDDEWGENICDTAIVRIQIIEDEETLPADAAKPLENMSDNVVISGMEKLVSDIDIINSNAVVAIDGDTAIVGDSSHDTFKGVVLVFARVNTDETGESTWTQQAKLTPPDDAAWTYFGWSVAIHRDTIIVGAWGDGIDNQSNKGCAHIFVRDGDDAWYHEAKLEAPDGAAEDHFGYDVAIHEDTAIVGAWWDDDNGEESGSAHVFVRYGDAWDVQDKLVAPDGAANDRFGNSVGIYGDTVVVGAWWDDADDTNITNSGSAHIYMRKYQDDGDGDGTKAATWTHEQKLMDIVGESEDRFGNRVAIYGDTVIVGARGDDSNGESIDTGSAYVLVRNGDTWTHQSKLVAPDGATGDQFGNSIAIHGDTVVVGARWDDDNGKDSGSAHVFVRDGDNTWTHRAKLLAADGDAEDYFGFSVGIHDETVVVGSMSGDAHVFSNYLEQ